MKFIANSISMLQALLILKAIVFTYASNSNSLSKSKSNTKKIQTLNLNKKNSYLAYANNSMKERLNSQNRIQSHSESRTQSLSSLIIEEKEVSVLKENSPLCDEPGFLCPFEFTCSRDNENPSSEHKCVKGLKFLKEPCTGEYGWECAKGLYCQRSERLAKLPNNGIIRLKNFNYCEIKQNEIITLNPKFNFNNFNEAPIPNKNCNLINHVCPIGTYCNLNKDFEYVCETGNKKQNEQCLGKDDYCSENLSCLDVQDNFENSIGKRILAGNFACRKVETEVSRLFAGFKYFLEECEKNGTYGKNTCMFGAYCDNTYEAGKSVCLRGKKKYSENCDVKILPGNENDCEGELECKCVGHIFKTCQCEKSFRTEINKIETKKFRVYKKLGR